MMFCFLKIINVLLLGLFFSALESSMGFIKLLDKLHCFEKSRCSWVKLRT